MPLISPTLPSDGTNAVASSVDTPLNAILTLINGGLDDANIASVSGTKITAGTLPNSALSATAQQGWNTLSSTLTWSADNGNRETVLNSTVDLTSVLSPGARFSIKRGTTPPTECMSFASASSQYASNGSPSGITFTGAFTCEAWVKITNYPSSSGAMIVERLDAAGQNGWYFQLGATGQVVIGYGGGSGTNFLQTYQSLPLNQWIHIAGVISSVSSKTGAIYLNGVSVPLVPASGSQTTLVQPTAALGVGAWASSPSQYFPGYMSEVRVWSAAQTQTQVQANMAINLTGSETNLVGLWQGNGNFADSTSNGNTLTASGGASATQADNPYNATEYGVITKVTSTQLTVFTGVAGSIPNMALNSPQYSLERTPYGFPSARDKWRIQTIFDNGNVSASLSSPTIGSWNSMLSKVALQVPIGSWKICFEGGVEYNASTAASLDLAFAISDTAVTGSSFTVPGNPTNVRSYMPSNTSGTFINSQSYREWYRTLAADTTFGLYVKPDLGSGTTVVYIQGGQKFEISAECAYI